MTNGDRIREMTDEELVKLLQWRSMPNYEYVPLCDCADFDNGCALKCPHEKQEKNVWEWLKEEYGA